jgi:hypothetical protein
MKYELHVFNDNGELVEKKDIKNLNYSVKRLLGAHRESNVEKYRQLLQDFKDGKYKNKSLRQVCINLGVFRLTCNFT